MLLAEPQAALELPELERVDSERADSERPDLERVDLEQVLGPSPRSRSAPT